MKDFTKGFVYSTLGIVAAAITFIVALPFVILWYVCMAIAMSVTIPFLVYQEVASRGLLRRQI